MEAETFPLSGDIIRAKGKKPMQSVGFFELIVRHYIAQLVRARRNARDLDIINRYATRLNAEALDVLDYQVRW